MNYGYKMQKFVQAQLFLFQRNQTIGMHLRKELQPFNFSLNHLNFLNDIASSKNFVDKQEDAICRSSERKN